MPTNFTRRSLILTAVLAALASTATTALISAACSNGARVAKANAQPTATKTPPPAPATRASGVTATPNLADVAEKALPSVVNISTTKLVALPHGGSMTPFFSDPFFRHFFGRRFGPRFRPRQHKERSLGSGVIVSADGVILTNNHVVARASKIMVTTSDNREFEAKVVGTDPKSDLAVLRLKGKVSGLPPLAFGDSNKLRLGEFVLAIGNPFGVGQTVTMGIVSAKGRGNVGIVDYEDFIQTDAAINPGNSGGALVDLRGRLVGVNTAILSRSGGYQGIGFAIPSNMAKPILSSLLKNGKVVRGFLGVSIQTLTSTLARAMQLGQIRGVLISDVETGSPADKAGLQRGDVVLSIDGVAVRTSARLRNIVASRGAGAKVELILYRGGKRLRKGVVLGELTAAATAAKIKPSDGALGGVSVGTLDAAARKRLGIPARIRVGVLVKSIEPGSPAQAAGLRPDDVIIQINRRPVRSVRDFLAHYRSASNTVVLLIHRRGHTFYLMLRK